MHTNYLMASSSGVQRPRRRTPEEKVGIVEETYLPGVSVSLPSAGMALTPTPLFTWRRLMAQGALTAAGAGEEVVPASEYRAANPRKQLLRSTM